MPLSTLVYQTTVTGQQVDAACKGLPGPPEMYSQQMFQKVLQIIYTDFETTLAQAIQLFISTGGVMFAPNPPSPIMCTPITISMSSFISSSSKTIADTIKTRCKPFAQDPVKPGQIKIEELAKQMFIDLCTSIPLGVSSALNSIMVQALPGSMAPPSVGILAPVPTTVIVPFVPADLQSKLQVGGLNPSGAQSLGVQGDSTAKAATASIPPRQAETQAGPKYWDAVLNTLMPYIKTSVEGAIILFMTIPGKNWAIPAGIPGNPLIPPSMTPTPSGVYLGQTM